MSKYKNPIDMFCILFAENPKLTLHKLSVEQRLIDHIVSELKFSSEKLKTKKALCIWKKYFEYQSYYESLTKLWLHELKG